MDSPIRQTEQPAPEAPDIPERPLGVTLLAAAAALAAGLIPLLSTALLFIAEGGGTVSSESPLSLLAGASINLALVYFAWRTWRGSDRARKFLLVLVTLHYGLFALNNVLLLGSGQVPPRLQPRLYGGILRGLLYPVLFFWYFNRPAVKAFFKHKA